MFEYAIGILANVIKENENLINIWQWENGEEDYCGFKREEITELTKAISILKEYKEE